MTLVWIDWTINQEWNGWQNGSAHCVPSLSLSRSLVLEHHVRTDESIVHVLIVSYVGTRSLWTTGAKVAYVKDGQGAVEDRFARWIEEPLKESLSSGIEGILLLICCFTPR